MAVTRYEYDELGNQVRSGLDINQSGAHARATRHAYDLRGQLTHTWGAAAYPLMNEYDAYGRLMRMTTYRSDAAWSGAAWPADPGPGDVTTWQYDEATGLLAAKTDAAGKAVSYSYTLDGRLAARTWARAAGTEALTTAYAYSPLTGELLGVDYPDGTPDVGYEYDRLGRQRTVTDAVGTRTFSYTALLQPQGEVLTGLYAGTLTRTYADSGTIGRATGLTLGAGYAIGHDYDAAGRVSGISWTIGAAQGGATYARVPSSELLGEVAYGTGPVLTYSYEQHRNLRTSISAAYGGSTLSEYRYDYDPLGRRSSVVNEGQAFAQAAFSAYDYNSRSELVEAGRFLGEDVQDTTLPVPAEARTYGYDPIGNRTTVTRAAVPLAYTANQLNQYQLIAGGGAGQATLAYDDDGNLTGMSTPAGATEFRYDAENRLVAVEPTVPVEGSRRVTFRYDYQGRRVEKIVHEYASGAWSAAPSLKRFFVYDGWNLLQELDGAGAIVRSYVWGLDLSASLQGAGGIGGLLTMVDASGSYGYLYDGNGNVGQLVDTATGTIGASYEYDPYGNVVRAAGALAAVNPYRFSTKYADDETGMLYYGYRYYSPELGRWLSRDPIGENAFVEANTTVVNHLRRLRLGGSDMSGFPDSADGVGVTDAYLFVGNNPLSANDYLGLTALTCWGNCVEKWRWDWGAIMGIALSSGTPISKREIEKLWLSRGVTEQSTWLSRAIGQANKLLIKLPLGSPVRTNLIGALKTVRHAARNPAAVLASTAASVLVIMEGFYDIGIEIRCGIECCMNSKAY